MTVDTSRPAPPPLEDLPSRDELEHTAGRLGDIDWESRVEQAVEQDRAREDAEDREREAGDDDVRASDAWR